MFTHIHSHKDIFSYYETHKVSYVKEYYTPTNRYLRDDVHEV